MDAYTLAKRIYDDACKAGIRTSPGQCLRVARKRDALQADSEYMKALPEMLAEVMQVTSSSIPGVQDKEWVGRTLYKWDAPNGVPSGLIEHVVSYALDFVTMYGEVVPHVQYQAVSVNSRLGCVCNTYKCDGETEISLAYYDEAYSLYGLLHSSRLQPYVPGIALWFLLDAMFYNEDRHLNNIVLLTDVVGGLRMPPIFDMGNSLMFVGEPNYNTYEPNPYLHEQVEWARSVIGDRVLKFDATKLYSTFDREAVRFYHQDMVDVYLKRILKCAESRFVSTFVEVV